MIILNLIFYAIAKLLDWYKHKDKQPEPTISTATPKRETEEPKKKWDPDTPYNGRMHCWIGGSRVKGEYEVDEEYIKYLDKVYAEQQNMADSRGILGVITQKPY